MLVVSPLGARIGYIGANPVLQRMLSTVIERLGFEHALAATGFDDMTAVEQLAEEADVFIVDLGLDVSHPGLTEISADALLESEVYKLPSDLIYALQALQHLIEVERARSEQVKHPRPMMLVNSSAAFSDWYVLAQFDCSHTTLHSRVRRATVKPAHAVDTHDVNRRLARAYRLRRWSRRHEARTGRVAVRPGESVDIGELEDYGGFGRGWAPPDEDGIWTVGSRAESRISLGEIGDGEYVLSLMVVNICVAKDELLRVVVLANGDEVATSRTGPHGCAIRLAHRATRAYMGRSRGRARASRRRAALADRPRMVDRRSPSRHLYPELGSRTGRPVR